MEKLEKIIIEVYRRIKNHDFSIPEEVRGLGELESIERFEEVLTKYNT